MAPVRRLRWLSVVALSCIIAAGCAQTAAAAPVLYVDVESRGGTCNDSRPATAVTKTEPWCSVERAVIAAPSGSTVAIRGGRYPSMKISDKVYAERTVYRAFSSDEPVELAGVSILNSTNVTVEGLRVVGNVYTRLSHQLEIFRNEVSFGYIKSYANVDSRVAYNHVHDVSPTQDPAGYGIGLFTFTGSYNERVRVDHNKIERATASGIKTVASRDLVIERNEIRESWPPPGSGLHTNAVKVDGGLGLTIRANRIDGAPHGLMFSDHDARGVLIENNLLTDIRYGYGVNGTVGPGARILGNTVQSRYGLNIYDAPADPIVAQGVVIMNNVFDAWGGGWAITSVEDYNLWGVRAADKPYGEHDVFGDPTYDSDYRLVPASRGYRAGFPDRDMGVLIDLWDAPLPPPPPPPASNPPTPLAPPDTGRDSPQTSEAPLVLARARKERAQQPMLEIVSRCRRGRLQVRLSGPDVRLVRRVRFTVPGARGATDRRRPFVQAARVRAPRWAQATVTLRDGRRVRIRVSAPACSKRVQRPRRRPSAFTLAG